MRILNTFILGLLALFLLSGCETKRQNFEPPTIAGDIDYDGSLPSSIIDVSRSGATLENGQIITEDGLIDVKLPLGFTFTGNSKEHYIGISRDSELIVVDKNSMTIYNNKFKSIVASASLQNNMLAVVLGNNTFILIDIKNDKVLFTQKGDNIVALDSKIAAPYFLTGLVIYPTLDGKLIIVDLKTYKVIRDVVVRSEKFFSNVIYLDVLGDRLVAATKKRVVSISPKTMTYLDEEIKDVIILKNRVLVFTKDGQIVLTDSDMKVLKRKKFKFASFAGSIYGKFVYVLERGGYLIATDLDLMSSNVYELPDDITDFVFTTKDKLYYKDSYFKLGNSSKK